MSKVFLTPEEVNGWLIVREDDGPYELRAHAEPAEQIAILWRGRVNFTKLFDFFSALVHGQPVTVEAQTSGELMTFERVVDRDDLTHRFEVRAIKQSDVMFLQCTVGGEDDSEAPAVAARVDLESLDTEQNRVESAPDDIELTLPVPILNQGRGLVARFIHQTNRYWVSREAADGSLAMVSDLLSDPV